MTNERLNALLKAAAAHEMTPQETWDQRVSFVHGQLMDCAPQVTKEEIAARATEMYGPRPLNQEEEDDS